MTERTMVAMLAMPRLPTPMAMREPGGRLASKCPAVSSRRRAPGMSEMERSGKCCRMGRSRWNGILESYRTVWFSAALANTGCRVNLEKDYHEPDDQIAGRGCVGPEAEGDSTRHLGRAIRIASSGKGLGA